MTVIGGNTAPISQVFSLAELTTMGLAGYFHRVCGCGTDRYRIVPLICVDGHCQYRIECTECERRCGGAIPRRKIKWGMISHGIVRSNADVAEDRP
jgi:hypothetical protein